MDTSRSDLSLFLRFHPWPTFVGFVQNGSETLYFRVSAGGLGASSRPMRRPLKGPFGQILKQNWRSGRPADWGRYKTCPYVGASPGPIGDLLKKL